MKNSSFGQPESSQESRQLEPLLDKLAAVRTNLERACGASKPRSQVVVSLEVIAGACEMLRAADADLRNLVQPTPGPNDNSEIEAYVITCERLPWHRRVLSKR